ncbi:MAG TPA: hypothetical protein V6D25_10905 [Leptolyngbyaceae cyanobacterium]
MSEQKLEEAMIQLTEPQSQEEIEAQIRQEEINEQKLEEAILQPIEPNDIH